LPSHLQFSPSIAHQYLFLFLFFLASLTFYLCTSRSSSFFIIFSWAFWRLALASFRSYFALLIFIPIFLISFSYSSSSFSLISMFFWISLVILATLDLISFSSAWIFFFSFFTYFFLAAKSPDFSVVSSSSSSGAGAPAASSSGAAVPTDSISTYLAVALIRFFTDLSLAESSSEILVISETVFSASSSSSDESAVSLTSLWTWEAGKQLYVPVAHRICLPFFFSVQSLM